MTRALGRVNEVREVSTPPAVSITWMPGVDHRRDTALTAHILESGWVQVMWKPGDVTWVSPTAILELRGKGVIRSDA